MLGRLFDPDVPFAPKRWPWFYGYTIIVASIVGVIASIPGQTVGVGVFNDSLIAATGLARADLSECYAIGTIISGLLLPWVGRLQDRLGIRLMAVLAALGLGTILAILARIDHLGALLIPLCGSSLAMWLVLVPGFVFLRLSGQGLLTMVSRNMLGKWWDRRRGRMAGLAGLFIAFGFAISPLVLTHGITAFGWRGTWDLLAVCIAGGVAGFAWLLFRDNPEECGLQMDGDTVRAEAASTQNSEEPRSEQHFTRAEALRTRAFWMITTALTIQGMVITGIHFHVMDIGAQNGYDRSAAVAFFLPMAVVSTATDFLVGLASDRWPLWRLVIIMLCLQILGFAAMPAYGDPWCLSLTILGLGGATGFFAALSTVALPRFFGRQHLGAIAGAQMSLLVLGSAAGPVVLAWSQEMTGTYDLGLWACTALPALGLVLAWRTVNPQEQGRQQSS